MRFTDIYGNAKFIAVSHNYIFGKLGVVIFPHDKFSTEISERVYEISSFDILSSSEEVADLLDSKYHNGNTLYVEDESGITIWKKIIDNSKFGTPNYKEGLKDFSILSPTNYSSISNTPNTFSGYNISDAVSKNELEAVKDVTHYVYTPSEYQIDAIGDSDIYVGIQKTLSNDGGGTEEYPMSTPHAELDVILAADAKTKSSSVQTHKCNCEADKCAYIERWIEGSIGTTNIEWIDICYGDGKYIAIGYDNETPCMSIAYSSDGLIWNFANIPSDVIDIRLYSVCYGDGKFVAVGELVAGGGAPIVYSSDGINWKVYLNIDLASLCSVCYGDGKFVAISEYDTVYTYSTDGINWTYCDIDSSTWTTGWKSICYGDGKFVVVGVCNNIAYSVNGIDWVVFDASPDTNTILLSVCYGNGKFVALGNDGNTDMYYYSIDGIEWTGDILDEYIRMWRVIYTNDKFIAISYDSNSFVYSIDGINWNEDVIYEYITNLVSICYGNGKCLAISDYGTTVQMIDYIGMPCCKATGLSILPSEIPADKYFSNIYLSDEENPNWNNFGLGRMIKVDKTRENTIIKEKYSINNHEYDVKVLWKPEVGVVFDLGVVEAVETCQSIYDNFTAHLPGVKSAIDFYNKQFTEEGLL